MATQAKFLTVKEAAEALGVSPNTVRAWGSNGKLPEYRHPLNNYRLFKASDVERLRLQIQKPVLQTVAKTKTKRQSAK
jgi:excisionase family DNA binding protein